MKLRPDFLDRSCQVEFQGRPTEDLGFLAVFPVAQSSNFSDGVRYVVSLGKSGVCDACPEVFDGSWIFV
jgi:hypothetical protein